MLCVAVQPFSGHSRVLPGHVAAYAVWIWSAKAQSRGVQVTTKVARVRGASSARFTVCPDLRRSVCDLGNLPVGQADELQVTVKVQDTATAGEKVRLTADAKAPGATAAHASANVVVVTTPPAPAPAPGSSLPPGGTLPPPSLAPLPGSSSDSSLFPTVTPGSGASPTTSPQPPATARHHGSTHATTVAATFPLSTRLIGGQLAGLAVLAGAIAMAIARLSLRSRPQDGKNPPS